MKNIIDTVLPGNSLTKLYMESRGKESSKVRITQKNKIRKRNSYQKMKRPPDERHT